MRPQEVGPYVLRVVARGGGDSLEVWSGLDVAVDAIRRHFADGAEQVLIYRLDDVSDRFGDPPYLSDASLRELRATAAPRRRAYRRYESEVS